MYKEHIIIGYGAWAKKIIDFLIKNKLFKKIIVVRRKKQFIIYPNYKLIILDEIIVAIKLGYLDEVEVINSITLRPKLTHVVLTGRGASKNLIDSADLVTEMKSIHHPFREQGVKAQEGIEY